MFIPYIYAPPLNTSMIKSMFHRNVFSQFSNVMCYNIDLQLDTRVLKFVHSCLNHCNSVCKSLLSAKLHCIKSTFAANYKYLSYKYKICQDDWVVDINLLIGKMRVQFEKETQSRSNAHTIVELCAIRDGIANCDIMSCTEASKLIDSITLE